MVDINDNALRQAEGLFLCPAVREGDEVKPLRAARSGNYYAVFACIGDKVVYVAGSTELDDAEEAFRYCLHERGLD